MSLALLAYALGAMRRRAGRNLAIVLGLAVVVWAFATVLFVGEGLRAASMRAAETAPVLTVERLVAGRAALFPVADAARVASLPSVRSATPRVWGYLYLAALEANVTVIGTADLAPLGIDGATTLAPDEAIFGADVARVLGLRAGDRIAVAAAVSEDDPSAVPVPLFLRVRAILPVSTALVAGDALLVDDAMARRLLDVPADRATDLAVDVFPPEEAPIVAAQVVDAIRGARVVDRESLGRSFELTFDARAGLLSAMLVPALLALLLLAWERLTGLGDEERREIGVLKALGWTTSNVLGARMTEAALVAAAGSLLGLGLAYVHAFVLGAPLLAPALFGWSNVRPALVVAPASDPMELAVLLAAVIVPFAGISVVPAWRAANVDPDRLLR